MTNLKKFIDTVSYTESKNTKTLVLSMTEARAIRDDLAKLLLDYQALSNKNSQQEIIEVKISGGHFK